MNSTFNSRYGTAGKLLLLTTSVLAIAACSGGSSPADTETTPAVGGGGGTPPAAMTVAARSFDMTIPSSAAREDGAGAVNISMSVFIPEHLEGETYPLVLHSHGFGGSRVGLAEAAADPATPRDRTSTSSVFGRLDDQVRLLWDDGYAIVSFDERGFGRGDDGDDGNDGQVQAMDPDYEVQDAISVLDWAEANLDISDDGNGGAMVGAIGGSYGGAYQLLLSALDPRLDAITPTATWYNLLQSLTPNDVIKKGYGTGLCIVINTDNADAGSRTTSACTQASDTTATNRYAEDITIDNAVILDLFRSHGMVAIEERHKDPNDSFTMRDIDALFIQGNRDILFGMTQMADNYRFLNGLGGDVRFMTMENGHSLRATRQLGGSQLDLGVSNCGPRNTLTAVRAWLDLKLRGNTAAEALLPTEGCISLTDDVSVDVAALPVADSSATQFDNFTVTINSTDVTSTANNTNSEADGIFVPLGSPISGNGSVLAGLPVASLTINDTVADARGGTTLFIGVGIQRGATTFLVDQQVDALRATDSRTGAMPEAVELIGIAEQLQDQDVVGVLLYGSFDQFEVTPGTPSNFAASNNVTVSGTVRLPIFDSTVQEFSAP